MAKVKSQDELLYYSDLEFLNAYYQTPSSPFYLAEKKTKF